MNRLLLLLPLLIGPAQDPGGVVLERRVHLWMRDPVDRVREFVRVERVKIRPDRVVIDDLTFGTRLIINRESKTVCSADLTAGTFSELSFDAIAARRKEAIEEIRQARARVAGSSEEPKLDDLLKGLGVYAAPPAAEVRTTPRKETVAGRECSGREILIDRDIQYVDLLVDPSLAAATPLFDAMADIGAWPPEVAAAVRGLGGFPLKGTMRYSLFLDRVKADEEVTAIRTEPIPDAAFVLPPGLKKVPLAGFEAAGGPPPEKPKSMTRSFKEDDIDRENNPLREETKDDPKPAPK